METKTLHMLEPWTESAKEIDGEPTDVNYRSIKAGCGYYDQGDELKGFELTGFISPKYSARIVACVNACAGISNEELEDMSRYFGKQGSTYYTLVADMRKAQDQRDELLAALKAAKVELKRLHKNSTIKAAHTDLLLGRIDITIESAIANAEKGGSDE
jgi:hypothetical protein